MQNIFFSLNTVAPVFVIILIGIFLKRIKIIDENFINTSSKIVFTIALPSLIFIKISQMDFSKIAEFKVISFGCFGILIGFIFSFIVAFIFIRDEKRRGVFIQGAFRGNYAIIGLALLFNMFGEAGLSKGAIILSFALPVFNILAIIGLVISVNKINASSFKKILLRIISNPNIIAVLIGIFFSYFKISTPTIIVKTLSNLSSIALPLALIGIGGSLNFNNIKNNLILGIFATFIKIVLMPVVFTFLAYYFGYRGENLVAIYLLFAVPTAVTSFIFAKEMDGDTDLAANIVLFTTLGSILTISLGIFILKISGLID